MRACCERLVPLAAVEPVRAGESTPSFKIWIVFSISTLDEENGVMGNRRGSGKPG